MAEKQARGAGEVNKCGPAMSQQIHGTWGRSRATTLMLPHGPLYTPVFMPVGTQGTVKGLTSEQLTKPPLDFKIILGNTYHLALRPTTELLDELGGLHKFMNWPRNILTDSGGFQMVSLLELAEITEEGVTFRSPVDGTMMLLKPEDSIHHQNRIGSDIMMALDDVAPSTIEDPVRFTEAMNRTIRWIDRCIAAHQRPQEQNLFGIIQGGLDVRPGGLREQCCEAFLKRDKDLPGYAIGGLAGGEDKQSFCSVVEVCARKLPARKPRYLMGVGYPLDLVVCTALGVDMFDCVYPTRTARFGTAMTPFGSLKLKHVECADSREPICAGCPCLACSRPYSRGYLHQLFKSNVPLAGQLVSAHNLCYLQSLMRTMRESICAGGDAFPRFVRNFMWRQFVSVECEAEREKRAKAAAKLGEATRQKARVAARAEKVKARERARAKGEARKRKRELAEGAQEAAAGATARTAGAASGAEKDDAKMDECGQRAEKAAKQEGTSTQRKKTPAQREEQGQEQEQANPYPDWALESLRIAGIKLAWPVSKSEEPAQSSKTSTQTHSASKSGSKSNKAEFSGAEYDWSRENFEWVAGAWWDEAS